MVSRKAENFVLDAFSLGDAYTRTEIANLGDVKPLTSTREWTGIVEFSNCVVLFSTLEKENLPIEHNYADVFSDRKFYWESRNRNKQTTPVIKRLISLECSVILFCRITNMVKGKTLPFVFVGSLTTEDYDGEQPVQMRFNVDNYDDDAEGDLKSIYEWRPESQRVLKPIEAPDRKPRIGGGQGRQSDPKKRKAIELRAMRVATEHYKGLGYSVDDTSANNPFDLRCTNANEVVRVEVKGLAGALGKVEVTIGEVLSARDEDCRTDLFVVHSISLKEKGKTDFVGEGGETVIERDWSPADDKLEAIRFRYSPQ